MLNILPKANWDVKVTAMSLDKLVESLKTYEMNIKKFKRDERNKEISLALKSSDSEDFDLDEDQVAFITNNFKNLFKKGTEYDRKGSSIKTKYTKVIRRIIISDISLKNLLKL